MKNKYNKKAMSRISKVIVVIQFAILVGAFCFVYFFSPHLDYPRNNESLDTGVVDFKFRNANIILVDDNPDFRNPMEIDLRKLNTTGIRFEPGTYYWKAVGFIESNAREFTITSNVGLELDEENSSLKNAGNVQLNVSEKTDSGTTGLVILDVQVDYPVDMENKTIYQGEQNEK